MRCGASVLLFAWMKATLAAPVLAVADGWGRSTFAPAPERQGPGHCACVARETLARRPFRHDKPRTVRLRSKAGWQAFCAGLAQIDGAL